MMVAPSTAVRPATQSISSVSSSCHMARFLLSTLFFISLARPEYEGVTAYDIGSMIDSRHFSLPEGTINNIPPRLCARMETASCTCRLTGLVQEFCVVNPSREFSNAGQSGSLTLCSSITFTSSPFSTATFTNLPKPSTRRCLITNKPGSTTSSTKQNPGMVCVVPQIYNSSSSCQTPKWIPERSTAGDSLFSTSEVSGRRCSNNNGCSD